jgi:tRNA C32,U32 (ribose-2'-O)-methylase TrmJ
MHLEDVLIEVDFLKPKNPGRLMQRLRRLILRSDLEREEVNILRGFLGAVQKKGR